VARFGDRNVSKQTLEICDGNVFAIFHDGRLPASQFAARMAAVLGKLPESGCLAYRPLRVELGRPKLLASLGVN